MHLHPETCTSRSHTIREFLGHPTGRSQWLACRGPASQGSGGSAILRSGSALTLAPPYTLNEIAASGRGWLHSPGHLPQTSNEEGAWARPNEFNQNYFCSKLPNFASLFISYGVHYVHSLVKVGAPDGFYAFSNQAKLTRGVCLGLKRVPHVCARLRPRLAEVHATDGQTHQLGPGEAPGTTFCWFGFPTHISRPSY